MATRRTVRTTATTSTATGVRDGLPKGRAGSEGGDVTSAAALEVGGCGPPRRLFTATAATPNVLRGLLAIRAPSPLRADLWSSSSHNTA